MPWILRNARMLPAILLSIALCACASVSAPSGIGSLATTTLPPGTQPLQATARYTLAPTLTALMIPGYVAGREAELVAIAKAECAGRVFCSIGIWNDEASVPHRLKMTRSELAGRKAQFVFNAATGLSRALWDCKSVNSIAGECL